MQFNETQDSLAERTRTTNEAGGEAFEPRSSELALYQVVINNFLEDKYYEDDEDSFENVRERFADAAQDNPEFVLKLAKYARQEMYLRQVPQLLLVLAANNENTKQYVRDYSQSIMDRADEPLEVLAMQVQLYGKSIPNPLQKGIEDALHNYDEYQFAKYDRNNREFRYRDLMNLVHPTPRDDERDEIFGRIVKGELDDYDVEPLTQHGTWEDAMSEAGQEDRDPAEVWRDKLDRMGLFATIRNVRNMLEDGLDAEEILTDEDLEYVSESMIYPFRFYTAYQAVKDAGFREPHVDEWFEQAIEESIGNVPAELGSTYVGVDLSGSMNTPLSENSVVEYKEISALFGGITAKKGAAVSGFGNDFHEFRFHSNTPVLEMQRKVYNADVGHSTNGWKVLRNLVRNRESYNKVVLFTDMQLWDSTGGISLSRGSTPENTVKDYWDEYTELNPGAQLYIVDLSSYDGGLVMPEGYNNVYQVSGWNSEMVKHIQYADNEDAAIAEVEAVEPDR
jgi:hypothetical protein